MTRIRPRGLFTAAAVVPLVALAVAGCGSNNDNGGSTASIKPASHSATVGVSNTGLGRVLTDSQGNTLYLFEKDTGGKSECSGGCATQWPPLRASGKPTAGSGLKASLLGTTQRSDGQPQVTYNGHPLYGFEGDSKPGDTNGQGINAYGALWYVLSSAGDANTTASSSGGTGGY